MGASTSSGKLVFTGHNGLSPGDKVKVKCSLAEFKKLQDGHGGWNDKMKDIIGKQLLLECFDKDKDALVSHNNSGGFYVNAKSLQKVLDRDIQLAKGDKFKFAEDKNKNSELHWLSPAPQSVPGSLKGLTGVVLEDDGVFAKVAIQFSNGDVYRANCVKDNLTWLRPQVLEVGDEVRVFKHKPTVEALQEGHGGYSDAMDAILGKTGFVLSLRPFVGCKVEFEVLGTAVNFMINSCLLEKVSKDQFYVIGDKVKITDNMRRYKANQNFHGGFNENVGKFCGKIGSVVRIGTGEGGNESLGDLGLKFFGVEGILIVNRRSVSLYQEDFSVGDEVACVLRDDILKKLTPKTLSYSSAVAAAKISVAGKVTSVTGNGDSQIVTVKYEDGKELKFYSKHVQKRVTISIGNSSGDTDEPQQSISQADDTLTPATQDANSHSSMEPRNGFAPGDYVTCEMDMETLKLMQEEHGGWNDRMKHVIGSLSLVKGFNGDGGLVISTRGDQSSYDEWHVYSGAMTKVDGSTLILGVGDHVQLSDRKEGVILSCSEDTCEVVVKEEDNTTQVQQLSFDQLQRSRPSILSIGDEVMLFSNEALIKKLQEEVKLPIPRNLELFKGKTGKVSKIAKMVDIGVRFNFTGITSEVFLNSRLLFKTSRNVRKFKPGDKVEVTGDLEEFKRLQQNHGGWNASMREVADETGSVVKIFGESSDGHSKGDLVVLFHQAREPFVLNPEAVTLKNDEEFEEGEHVVCVIPYALMKKFIPVGHFMQGLHNLRQKAFDRGTVTAVEGTGEYALVTVKYEEGSENSAEVQITFFAKHILSTTSGDLGAMLMDALNMLLTNSSLLSDNDDNNDDEAQSNTGSASGSAPTSPGPSAPNPQPCECIVCFGDENMQWVCFSVCGHVLCQACAEKILNDDSYPGYRRCPQCNAVVEVSIKLFF